MRRGELCLCTRSLAKTFLIRQLEQVSHPWSRVRGSVDSTWPLGSFKRFSWRPTSMTKTIPSSKSSKRKGRVPTRSSRPKKRMHFQESFSGTDLISNRIKIYQPALSTLYLVPVHKCFYEGIYFLLQRWPKVVPILLQAVRLLPEEGAAASAVVQMVAVVPTACIGPRHPQKTKKFW